MRNVGIFLRRLLTVHLIVGFIAMIIHLFFGLLSVLRILNGTDVLTFVTSRTGLFYMGAFWLTWPLYSLSNILYANRVGYIVIADIIFVILVLFGALWAYFKTFGTRSKRSMYQR